VRGLEIIPVTPDLYCPYCGRLLVQATDQGIVLAGKTTIAMVSKVDPFNLPEDDQVEGFVEATCLRRRCALRREWEAKSTRERQVFYISVVLALALFGFAIIQIGGLL
jgi:hypothetical protein